MRRPARANDAVPGQTAFGIAQRPNHLACRSRETGSARNFAISGDLAFGNFPDRPPQLVQRHSYFSARIGSSLAALRDGIKANSRFSTMAQVSAKRALAHSN